MKVWASFAIVFTAFDPFSSLYWNCYVVVRLYVASESRTDNSKSISSHLREIFSDNQSIEVGSHRGYSVEGPT